MATFKFTMLVNAPLADIVTAPLGASAGATFTDKDIGKTVKLAAGDKYVPCADGDFIDGIVVAVDKSEGTVNSGYNLGSVQKNRRFEATVAAGAAQVAVGDKLVAGTPLAVGTVGKPQVKKYVPVVTDLAAVQATIPLIFGKPIWEVISIVSGNGSAGDTVLIERKL